MSARVGRLRTLSYKSADDATTIVTCVKEKPSQAVTVRSSIEKI